MVSSKEVPIEHQYSDVHTTDIGAYREPPYDASRREGVNMSTGVLVLLLLSPHSPAQNRGHEHLAAVSPGQGH
ncbi:hypothetical protein E2C01_006579 [Portunus trituberculatus]|uniref:Uncharacterized protein n=1 Tax=Portunus trituberculatus TaxID=210409 RepID=A0A5B7CY86_PORTR|nr:hypothetical protein [Portunus trituberculatus]